MKKAGLFLILLLLVTGAAASLWWWRSTPKASADLILKRVRSSQSDLVLVNFWASWCEPCKEELPALWELKSLYPENNLKIFLVSIDDASEIEKAEAFLRENNMNFITFYKGAQSLKFVLQIYPNWSGAVPASVIMNSDAKILDAWEGDSTLEELKQRVQKQLRANEAQKI